MLKSGNRKKMCEVGLRCQKEYIDGGEELWGSCKGGWKKTGQELVQYLLQWTDDELWPIN